VLSLDGLSIKDPASAEKQLADSDKGKRPQKPFPLMDLPPELRLKVYSFHFAATLKGGALDLDPDNYKLVHAKLLPLLCTCRAVHEEASHFFYSSHVFRLFPTHYVRPSRAKKPLLARISARHRRYITTLEFRVGPGWNKPPRGWVVNSSLGLRDCVNARRLRVFVEFDPGHPAFEGWRKSDGFYEEFCRKLLDGVLAGVPSLAEVEFDSVASVKLSGGLMRGMLNATMSHGRRIVFGPTRGWKSIDDVDDDEKALASAMKSVLLGRAATPVVVAVS
jgi:hypothetical protein